MAEEPPLIVPRITLSFGGFKVPRILNVEPSITKKSGVNSHYLRGRLYGVKKLRAESKEANQVKTGFETTKLN